jgi:large conductance mechanosensitive channel
MFKEFKEFAMKGNVIDMAVGIITGGAFGTIVNSLVSDVIMPPIGLLLGGVDFSELFIILKHGEGGEVVSTLAEAQEAGAVTINYGLFINSIISFLIITFAVFMMVRLINRLRREEEEEPAGEPTTIDCPYCFTEISIKATKCPNCTSQLN